MSHEEKEEFKRTSFAAHGVEFSVLFQAKFMRTDVSGYTPVLREPPGVSTGGGKQAMQHIALEPKIQGDPVLTIGAVNVATKTAKLRSYECMAEMHRMRFGGRPFSLDPRKYQGFFDQASEFFRNQGLQIEIETRPPMDSLPMQRPSPVAAGRGSSTGIVVVAGIVVVLGLLLLLWWRGFIPIGR